MGLRREIQEELKKQEFEEGHRCIAEEYYTDPDDKMRGFVSSVLHKKFVGEYEPSPEKKRIMELELENNRLKHGCNN